MSHIGKVATVELIRELERRLKCSEVKTEKYVFVYYSEHKLQYV